MERAGLKYRILKTRKKWEAPSPEDEKILALETTISDMKAKWEKKKSPRKSNN